MTLSLHVKAGQGRYASDGTGPIEWDSMWIPTSKYYTIKKAAVWCHGNNGTQHGDYSSYGTSVFHPIAQTHALMVSDLGGSTFGNDLGILRLGQALDYLENTWNMEAPFTVVAASMGASVALNYTARHPERIKALALIIPAIDFSTAEPGNPALTNLNLAYPPAYDEETHGAYNPINQVDDLPEDLPIHIWYSSNDPVALPSAVEEFLSLRPQTESTILGALGHSGVATAGPLVASWINTV